MIISSSFHPAPLFKNRHLQTILPNLGSRRAYRGVLERETLELPDGDFLHLDWLKQDQPDPEQPLLLCLHGLEGSSRSNYAGDLIGEAQKAGWNAVVMHFRGCSGELNRLPRSYHGGDTADLASVLSHLRQTGPAHRKVFAAGYSLGGNLLLKYLGEQGSSSAIDAAAAISVPFDLYGAALTVDQGFSRRYQAYLMRKMLGRIRAKSHQVKGLIDLEKALNSQNFIEFDEYITAPLHGFKGHRDYYNRCSSIGFLKDIGVPTLVLHSRDDPFLNPRYLPTEDQISDSVRVEYSEHGGHVGFIAQKKPWQPMLWLPRRILQHFGEQL